MYAMGTQHSVGSENVRIYAIYSCCWAILVFPVVASMPYGESNVQGACDMELAYMF